MPIAFVREIEVVVDTKFDSKKEVLATKEDISLVRIDLKEQKAELIKWMFIFWASQIAATIGFIMLYVKR